MLTFYSNILIETNFFLTIEQYIEMLTFDSI